MLVLVTGMAMEAKLARRAGFSEIVVGSGPEVLLPRLENAARRGATAFLNVGIAGGLADGLGPGTPVIASEVAGPEGDTIPATESLIGALRETLPEAECGLVACAAAPVASVEAKRMLRARTGALAVDMESWQVAEVAQRTGLSVGVLRVIADPADQALPAAAFAALRPDGTIDGLGVAGSILSNPAQIPQLLATQRVTARATAELLRCLDLLRSRLLLMDFR